MSSSNIGSGAVNRWKTAKMIAGTSRKHSEAFLDLGSNMSGQIGDIDA